jgi:hypothetical protein
MLVLLEPRIGAVYVYIGRPSPERYIILDAADKGGSWELDLLDVVTKKILHGFNYYPASGNATIEPLADGEEVLFFQAMLAPHTLKGGSDDQSAA